MRTDVTIDTKEKLRIPGFIVSGCRPWQVGRGDFITFRDPGRVERIGRIIGTVINPDDGLKYLCVVMLMMGGGMWERWVLPEDVTDTRYGDKYMCLYADKAGWFHSPEFLDTPVNKQRNVSNLLYEQLLPEK
jgi:hypothetical protein